MIGTPFPDGSLLRLVRHGQSTYNAAGLLQGHDDRAELTPIGLAEAERAAHHVAGRPVGMLVCSDLRRAHQTAAVISQHLELHAQVDRRLRERSLGRLEGAPVRQAVPELIGILDDVVVDPDARPTGGESLRQFYDRVAGFLSDLEPCDGDVVVVGHGGTVRMAVAVLAGTPVEQIEWRPVANGSVTDVALPALAGTADTGGGQ